MSANLYVHIPAQLLPTRLPFLLNRNLQPEVACQEVSIESLDLREMARCSEQLAEKGLTTTVHAPFAGFKPGSPKNRDQKKARTMCQRSLDLAAALQARVIVFHPGIPYRATPKQQAGWLQNCLDFWPEFIAQAELLGVFIAIENIYEPSPEIFLSLFQGLNSPAFGHCFDIGHWNIFSETSLSDWFAQLGPHTRHIHLHDNNSRQDEHLPIGAGQIDFQALFDEVRRLPQPPSITLEAHKLPELEVSLKAVQQYLA